MTTATAGAVTNEESNSAKAASAVSAASKWSAAAGFIPVPYLDLAGLAAIQVQMVLDISKIYGQKADKELVRGAVATLLGTMAPASLAAPVAGSFLKLVPGLGSLAGGASMAALGAAATYAIGKVFTQHFEDGGNVESFSAEAAKNDAKQAFDAKAK
ncbi:MAG: DUF697 domain-containing protein [Gammaproteobacteria bacterium]|jgi:uncharacterized protein (DUF697 family)|nr:DUF697 domain-containing protein [Gammaproteobacteria bacterium]